MKNHNFKEVTQDGNFSTDYHRCYRVRRHVFISECRRKQEMQGKNEQQKQVIKYLYGGCMTFGKMTDADYDSMVASVRDSLNLKQKALNKIGLDEDQLREIEPVFFEGYANENLS